VGVFYPMGKWVSTGKESLKSGLSLDPNVAAAYEENWGKAPPKHGDVVDYKQSQMDDTVSNPNRNKTDW